MRYNGRTLYNPNSPRTAAERRASALSPEPDTLYLVASPLLGYGLHELQRHLPASSRVIAVELNADLAGIEPLEHPSGIPLIRESVVEESSLNRICAHLFSLIPGHIRRVRLISLSGGSRFAAERYDQLVARITKELARRWRNIATRIHFGRKWIRHMFRNLATTQSLSAAEAFHHALHDAHRSTPNHAHNHRADTPRSHIPAVVCGAGESLEWCIPFLRRTRERIYILAVDTALGTLRESGIAPDGVVALESQVINVSDFLAGLPARTALYYDLTVHPCIPELAVPQMRRPFLTRFTDLSLLTRVAGAIPLEATIPPFASVGVTAVHLASTLTAGPIILAGLDFAYTLGKPHARGTLSHRLELSRQSRLHSPILYNHGIHRPRTRGTTETGIPYQSEPSLSDQTSILQRAAETAGRIYTLARRGPPLHVPELPDAMFEKLVDESGPLSESVPPHQQNGAVSESVPPHQQNRPRSEHVSPHQKRRPPSEPAAPPQSVRAAESSRRRESAHAGEHASPAQAFLEHEARRLQKLLDDGTLSGLEYLYFDFPDAASRELLNSSKASLDSVDAELSRRIRVRAKSYRGYIETLIELMKERWT